MDREIKLICFPKQKYLQWIVAVQLEAGGNMRLFAACDLFLQADTFSERKRVFDVAGKFAEKFVQQMNSAGLNYGVVNNEYPRT